MPQYSCGGHHEGHEDHVAADDRDQTAVIKILCFLVTPTRPQKIGQDTSSGA
jgi:hypothetical protein